MRFSSIAAACAPLLAAAALAAPAAALAQPAPAAWSTPEGRWEHWEDGDFANSTAQYDALKAAAHGGVQHTKLDIPDWSGLWTSSRAPGFGAPRYAISAAGVVSVVPPRDPGDAQPEIPLLTPPYAVKLKEELDRVAHGVEWDYLSLCLPAGFPRWYTEPFLREFITTPKETWMTNEQQSEVRRIYTDGRGHTPEDERYPLFEGDSIGFWDGDTLVIHTISVKAGDWNRSHPEYSEQMETVELVRKTKAGLIETRMTAYDPVTLQKPWHARFASEPVTTPDLRINMWSCNENNNVVKTADGASTFVLPGENGYKDPGKLTAPPAQ